MKTIAISAFLHFNFNMLVAQSMVKDIDPNNGSSPAELTTVGNSVFFSANDGKNEIELWKSNGTDTEIVRVKSVNINTVNTVNTI